MINNSDSYIFNISKKLFDCVYNVDYKDTKYELKELNATLRVLIKACWNDRSCL